MEKNKEILLSLTSVFRIIFYDKIIKLIKKTIAVELEKWNSLNQLKIILYWEKKFSVRLNPREVNGFENIGDMVDHLISIRAKT